MKEKQCNGRSQIFRFNSSEAKHCSEENSAVSVVRDFILIVVKVKQRSGRSQRFPFNSTSKTA